MQQFFYFLIIYQEKKIKSLLISQHLDQLFTNIHAIIFQKIKKYS